MQVRQQGFPVRPLCCILAKLLLARWSKRGGGFSFSVSYTHRQTQDARTGHSPVAPAHDNPWALTYCTHNGLAVLLVCVCVCQCGVGRTEQGSVLDSGCLPEKQYEINTSPSYTWGSWTASNAATWEELCASEGLHGALSFHTIRYTCIWAGTKGGAIQLSFSVMFSAYLICNLPIL